RPRLRGDAADRRGGRAQGEGGDGDAARDRRQGGEGGRPELTSRGRKAMRNRLRRAGLVLALALLPTAGRAADAPIRLEVRLGDVSLNKWMFLIAADTGIYARNGLDVVQFITPRAAQVVQKSGVLVQK